jgi:hypothetical protein
MPLLGKSDACHFRKLGYSHAIISAGSITVVKVLPLAVVCWLCWPAGSYPSTPVITVRQDNPMMPVLELF